MKRTRRYFNTNELSYNIYIISYIGKYLFTNRILKFTIVPRANLNLKQVWHIGYLHLWNHYIAKSIITTMNKKYHYAPLAFLLLSSFLIVGDNYELVAAFLNDNNQQIRSAKPLRFSFGDVNSNRKDRSVYLKNSCRLSPSRKQEQNIYNARGIEPRATILSSSLSTLMVDRSFLCCV